MRVRFLLGPAGSGKTTCCVREVQEALRPGSGGKEPLLFLAPKQATFQLERQVLSDPAVGGFARLQILSFERLAQWVLEESGRRADAVLGEEGRVMVLRALLSREEGVLKFFGRAGRSPGMAREVSALLRLFQEHGHGPGRLKALASREDLPGILRAKLGDCAHLLGAYREWLEAAGLEDASELPWLAVSALKDGRVSPRFEAVWMDGFAEMTPAEVALLAAVSRRAGRVTAAFCLDPEAVRTGRSGLWNVVSRTYRACRAAMEGLLDPAAGAGEIETVELAESGVCARFADVAVLGALERRIGRAPGVVELPADRSAVRVLRCQDGQQEAEVAADAIVDHVRGGGRFRDVAVLVRSLDEHGPVFARVFRQRGIPAFLDHRHGLRHHPLVELTRTAMRVAVDAGSEDDWFAWLKCGLLPLTGWEGEELENELRRTRWAGRRWLESNELPESHRLGASMRRVTMPLRRFCGALAGGVEGPELAEAIRGLWRELEVEKRLTEWDDAGLDVLRHQTVLHEMEGWLGEASRAFRGHRLAVSEWLPIVESAWGGLTAGALPPSLDQVLVGAIDRSRNPELRLAILPGWVEGGFPAPAPRAGLLSVTDRECLERLAGMGLGPAPVDRVHHEHFYAYIALTRSRGSVLITVPASGLTGGSLVPSPLLKRWLPEWEAEPFPRGAGSGRVVGGVPVVTVPPARAGRVSVGEERLSGAMVEALFGGRLLSSASGLERMASCRFAHFAASVLGLGEREELDVDPRSRGDWSHQLLAGFHRDVTGRGLRWRDLTPDEAEAVVRQQAALLWAELVGGERALPGGAVPSRAAGSLVSHALLATERLVVEWVRQWIGVLARWPADPAEAEVRFGFSGGLEALAVPVEGGEVRVRGSVDRVDLFRDAEGRALAAWVVDYKSGDRTLDEDRVAEGFELQLALYARAVSSGLGVPCVGVTYAGLQRKRERGQHRGDDSGDAGYSHRGRIEADSVAAVAGPVSWGELPFSVRLKKDGTPAKGGDALAAGGVGELEALAVARVKTLGSGLFAGEVGARPVRAPGASELPCERCEFVGVCRVGSLKCEV